MTTPALLLLLVAAVLHASWNYCAKRAGGGLPFVFTVGLVIVAGYLPATLIHVAWHGWPRLPWMALGVVGASGLLRVGYSLYLQRGYRHGDFSIIYPLARGTGPLFSVVAAIVLFGERPGALALGGAGLVVGAIFILTGGAWRASRPAAAEGTGGITAGASLRYGFTAGLFIAGYTVWDKYGVAGWGIPPLLFDGGAAVVQVLALAPFAARRWPEVREVWATKRRWVLGVALLSPVSYVLVLTAMTFTPVSYVAPAREVSIVIGAFVGARVLREGDGPRRLVAAAVMFAGIVALAVG